MSPETTAQLAKAREYLVKARNLLDVLRYNDDAGRAAYLAAFHAAQALISERTGRVAKTHNGVNRQFHMLTRADPGIDPQLRSILARTYSLKAIADYETGPDSVIPAERLDGAIAAATRFVEFVADTLAR